MSQPRNAAVLRFQANDDRHELERLRRLTGLTFESVPQSLLANGPGAVPEGMPALGPACRPALIAGQGRLLSAPDHQ